MEPLLAFWLEREISGAQSAFARKAAVWGDSKRHFPTQIEHLSFRHDLQLSGCCFCWKEGSHLVWYPIWTYWEIIDGMQGCCFCFDIPNIIFPEKCNSLHYGVASRNEVLIIFIEQWMCKWVSEWVNVYIHKVEEGKHVSCRVRQGVGDFSDVATFSIQYENLWELRLLGIVIMQKLVGVHSPPGITETVHPQIFTLYAQTYDKKRIWIQHAYMICKP